MSENKLTHERPADSTRFESDIKKVVRKHMEDKDHVFTEEDIRNVRVGMTQASGQQPVEDVIPKK